MSRSDGLGDGPNHPSSSPGARLSRDSAVRGPARPAPYVAAGILLAAAILFPLMPQTYSFDAPRMAGLPFFYWYQLLWVPISAGMTGGAYWLISQEDRRRRAATRTGGPPGTGSAPGGPPSSTLDGGDRQ
ncbi:hypothetical protein QFZ36_000730 [Pseudarthrobacter siccitolerans]|uniref:DUF3311 domain-containing protein n=1 Tax=Pseudarthrobacter siccitolerans TaxID=861266 RepID=A0ABU0PGS8_9MICC|nr:DUF3311 domain-containing protein [Pseudarthrobacter siccitolerans]MDQ0673169.1 hypothetical protein [Pseudarthrobacter siccitolerans]